MGGELSVNAEGKCERDTARQSLDELFTLARRYRSSEAYKELLDFIANFRFYAPFNAMLVHIQKPGAKYVATPYRWLSDYHRRIKAEAQPLVILQPMGPVMFVFDVSDTEPEKDAPPLPANVERPFDVRQGHEKGELGITINNAKRDGISVGERKDGSQRAGSIAIAKPGQYLSILVKQRPAREYLQVPLRYSLILNSSHSTETRYATSFMSLPTYTVAISVRPTKGGGRTERACLTKFRNLKPSRFVISCASGWASRTLQRHTWQAT